MATTSCKGGWEGWFYWCSSQDWHESSYNSWNFLNEESTVSSVMLMRQLWDRTKAWGLVARRLTLRLEG